MLAAKAALAIRYDALGEDTNAEMGAENRAKLEARLRQLEEKGVSTIMICGQKEKHRISQPFKQVSVYVSNICCGFFLDPKNQWNRQSNGKGRQIPAQEVKNHKLLFYQD